MRRAKPKPTPMSTRSPGGIRTSPSACCKAETDPDAVEDDGDTGDSARISEESADKAGPTADVDTSELRVTADVDASELRVTADVPADSETVPLNSFAPRTMSSTESALVSTTVAPPTVPSLPLWPTAFDPTTVVTYVTGIVSSLVNAVLSPFAAGAPALPADPPTLWTLLAWVRREFFNSSPTIAYDPVQNSQSLVDGDVLIMGNVGADDVDDDQLTYTVIGRPLNGGVVAVDDDGNFTYRPMNAMAAVGGTDSFVVVVSEEAAGLHIHGLLGLLQFVPIVGNFLNPGGGHAVAQTITVDVARVAGVDLSLPDDFHWGVAHSGFQAEGGPGSPVDPNSDWYRWVHDPINQLLGLTKGVPEDGPGAYVKYDTDAALAREELGMNTFRMGIEWSRIFPNSTASVDISDDGGVVTLEDLQALDALANEDEVQHYRDVLGIPACTRAGTHGHGHPLLVADMGAQSDHDAGTRAAGSARARRRLAVAGHPRRIREVRRLFGVEVRRPGRQLGHHQRAVPAGADPVLAMPGVVPAWPPGLIRPDLASTFLVNQAKAHVAAYDEIHAWDTTEATEGQPAAFVGFTNNMVPARPANPVNPLDVQAADAWNQSFNSWFPNAVIDGWVDSNLDGIKQSNEVHDEFKHKVDFMGVQYYGSQPMRGFGIAPIPGFPFLRGFPVRCSADSQTCSDFNQPIDPGGFREVLEIASSYTLADGSQVPLWVTENGIADDDETKRPGYLANHIAVVQDLVAHGTDIRGYTYWSFVDNLEWSEGYGLQFGLYGSDPTTPELERTPKPESIGVISGITGANALPMDVLEMYVPGAAP